MTEVIIDTEYIKLDQFLKFSGIAGTGGNAKDMIFAGIVSVNGNVCTVRGKKIREGDIVSVEFDDGKPCEFKVKQNGNTEIVS